MNLIAYIKVLNVLSYKGNTGLLITSRVNKVSYLITDNRKALSSLNINCIFYRVHNSQSADTYFDVDLIILLMENCVYADDK